MYLMCNGGFIMMNRLFIVGLSALTICSGQVVFCGKDQKVTLLPKKTIFFKKRKKEKDPIFSKGSIVHQRIPKGGWTPKQLIEYSEKLSARDEFIKNRKNNCEQEKIELELNANVDFLRDNPEARNYNLKVIKELNKKGLSREKISEHLIGPDKNLDILNYLIFNKKAKNDSTEKK